MHLFMGYSQKLLYEVMQKSDKAKTVFSKPELNNE